MDLMEDQLVEMLALADLLRDGMPMAPHSPAGPITYPRWGDIYWITGFPPEDQTKRYVVVSHDHVNAATGGRPLVVRTTKQDKRNAQDFPAIQGGEARGCCGELRSAKPSEIVMARRPDPPNLAVADMADIARGIASVFGLEAAVERAGGAL